MSKANDSIFNATINSSSQVFLTLETLNKVLFAVYYLIAPPILFMCCVSNVLNIFVFVRMGISDSVILSFLALSIADLIYSSTLFIKNIWAGLGLDGMRNPISAFAVTGYIGWYKSLFLDMSMLTTVYIAVVRCCCVALPFTFKSSFTVRRTTLVLAIITLASVALRIPHLSSTGLSWQTNPVTNTSRFTVWFSDNFATINTVVLLIDRIILPMSVLSIVSVCSIVLRRALVRASKVRQGMTGGIDHSKNSFCAANQSSEHYRNIAQEVNEMAIQPQECSEKNQIFSSENTSGQLSRKDVRLVKAVIMVTMFLLMSTFVMSVNDLVTVFVPDYYVGRRYYALFVVMINIEECFNYLNATVNTLIYLKFNTKFRKVFRQMFLGTCRTL